MIGLLILFLILALVFGVWGFAYAAWVGIRILFYVFLALLVLSLLGALFRPWGPVP